VQSKMEQPQFGKKLAERMWKIEGLFAEAKQNHCLSRAKYRGRSKVQIQAYLCAMVQNLKRLLFLLYQWLADWWHSNRPSPTSPISAPVRKSDFFNTPHRFLGRSNRREWRRDLNSANSWSAMSLNESLPSSAGFARTFEPGQSNCPPTKIVGTKQKTARRDSTRRAACRSSRGDRI
jgi:DDE family transposase